MTNRRQQSSGELTPFNVIPSNWRNIVDIISIICGIFFIGVAIHAYFMNKISFTLFLGALVLLGGGTWVTILSMKSKSVPIATYYKKNKSVSFILDISCILLGIVMFLFLFKFPVRGDSAVLNLALRIIFLFGALFLGGGGVIVLIKNMKKGRR